MMTPGEAVAFIGRSGAGKTTALRAVNGMVSADGGSVRIDGVDLGSLDLVAHRRRTGYVIQGCGLFPHRSVYRNVATVPRLLGWPEERTRAAAGEILLRVGLPVERFGERMPRSLSGGEQQRVGIARALAASPEILLCDEPFASLDPVLRRDLQDAFLGARGEGASTMIFVTHDLREAMRVAGRICLIDEGRIVLDVPAREFAGSAHPLARRFVESAFDV